jgi:mRNA-degrading endonuclease RelE of RelBE toxin-antitoxin system
VKPVSFSKDADKALRMLLKSSHKEAKTIARRIMELRSNGLTPHCKLLQNSSPPVYRSRCGDYRIIYELHPDYIEILAIGHRREVYTDTKNKGIS